MNGIKVSVEANCPLKYLKQGDVLVACLPQLSEICTKTDCPYKTPGISKNYIPPIEKSG
jgi:hypothetical protein